MVSTLSEVAICNNALLKIHANTIAALTDNSKEGVNCNILYPQLRDEVLAAHPWNFATRQATLSLLSISPIFEFDNAYQLPDDCIRMTKMENQEFYRWKIKNRELHTDLGIANVEYIRRETDTTLFNPQFAEALSTRLAAELAYNIAGSASRADALFAQYMQKLKEAKRRDGQEGIPDPLTANMWVDSRTRNWDF